MDVTFVVAGHLTREYVLPPVGTPLLDVPGGSALYACGGLLTWGKQVGILARVGEDYPRQWLREIETHGVDVAGVSILQKSVDVRAFHAYDSQFQITHGSPVSQFARRGLTFPKALLGYQPPPDAADNTDNPEFLAPSATEIPAPYRDARALHLCPLDLMSHHQISGSFRAFGVTTLTIDPASDYMTPSYLQDLRGILSGLTAFLPSEEDLRALFWDRTYDLWEMITAIGDYGCEIVVVKCGANGQVVLDVKGNHKWEIPAYPARRADPTGAGDAFCGGFLAGFKRTYDPLQAALHGNIAASLKLEGSGAFYPLGVLQGLAEARLDVLKDLVRAL